MVELELRLDIHRKAGQQLPLCIQQHRIALGTTIHQAIALQLPHKRTDFDKRHQNADQTRLRIAAAVWRMDLPHDGQRRGGLESGNGIDQFRRAGLRGPIQELRIGKDCAALYRHATGDHPLRDRIHNQQPLIPVRIGSLQTLKNPLIVGLCLRRRRGQCLHQSDVLCHHQHVTTTLENALVDQSALQVGFDLQCSHRLCDALFTLA